MSSHNVDMSSYYYGRIHLIIIYGKSYMSNIDKEIWKIVSKVDVLEICICKKELILSQLGGVWWDDVRA